MEDIRKAASSNSGFQSSFIDSLQNTITLLTATLSRLNLKEKPLTLQAACSEEEIEQVWQNVLQIDSTLQKTDTQKRCLKSRPALQSFMEHCCIERRYFFCIKKCGKEDCDICESPRLPQTEFSRLNFFPDPMKKPASDSYLSFEEVWGKETSEKDRPSCTPPKKPKEKPKKPFRMTAETVCDYVVCMECLKPRCVYSSKRLTHAQYAQLQCYKEEFLYSCGGSIIPEESSLAMLCCTELISGCHENITPNYYASRLTNPPCCYVCGAFGDLCPVSDEMKRSYQSVHPVCNEYSATGKKERTRGPRFTGRKRKATESGL